MIIDAAATSRSHRVTAASYIRHYDADYYTRAMATSPRHIRVDATFMTC